jgi:CRISPR-associated protein Cas2
VAARLRYLLAYDIRDPRRLRRVHRTAQDYGEPLQFSLFVCDLTKVELLRLKASLIAEMNLAVDSVGIFDLGTPADRGVKCIEFIGARRDLPKAGPAIW